jgi:cytoskeleton protein RodZ
MTDLIPRETTDLDPDLVKTGEHVHPDWAHVPDEPEADEVVVRRNGRISVVLAAISALLAAAYFARAVTDSGLLDWALCLGLTAITWAYVFSFLDSRMPLLVADSHGVRIRLGRTWRGMAWSDLEEVEHTPRGRVVRDGRLVLFPRDTDAELDLLGPAGRRHARFTERMHGAPFALPLGLTTRVLGARGDLTGALTTLADGRCEVVEVVPEAAEEPAASVAGLDDYYEAPEATDDEVTGEIPVEVDTVTPDVDEPQVAAAVVASPTPAPLRDVRPAVRADVAHDREWDVDTAADELPAIPSATSTFVIDDLAAVPAVEPVIGPELAAARRRLRLSVDQLSERTRIRPHVVEAIEIDDFAPCGGDFYARGHLRTLARVLGVDVAPLLATYDEKYADAPIDPRRVFEAELATGRHGSIRGVKGGPNWSVIVAAVMTVVLAWSVARLVMDQPHSVTPASPSLADGSAGLTSGGQAAATPVPVVLSAAGGGARVVVRDGTGKVVFSGSLAFGQSRTVQVAPPVRIQTTDGSLEVTVDGRSHGAMGKTGEPAQDVFTGR